MKKQEESALNILLGQAKKITKNIISNKNNNTHMICFPKFWFIRNKNWNSRYVSIKVSDNSVFIHPVTKENSNNKLSKIGGTHYIKLNDLVLEALNYPRELQLEYFNNYLVLTVTEREKLNISSRKVEIELRKRNELMKRTYQKAL